MRKWMYDHPWITFLVCLNIAFILTAFIGEFLGCAPEPHHQIIKPTMDRIGPPTYGDVVESDMPKFVE